MDRFALNSKVRSVSVIMPVYNEEANLKAAVAGISRTLEYFEKSELIIVESNSTDSSRDILQNLDHAWSSKVVLKTIYEDVPKGKGHALRAGLLEVSSEVIVIYDADEEYSHSDLLILIEPLELGEASFVLGSRNGMKGPMRQFEGDRARSTLYNLGHLIFTGWFNFLFGTQLKDPFTMWKVFRIGILSELDLTANRFDIDWELLGKSARLGCKISEIPITYSARGFSEGKKVRTFLDPLNWIIFSIKYRFTPLNLKK